MPKTPLGRNFYNGLAIPARGESEMRQEDSSRTMLTMTHSSLNTGNFMTFRDWGVEGSTITSVNVAAIDADGGFIAYSGSTLKLELNSSGLYAGSTLIIDTSGAYIGPKGTVAVDGATTNYVILSSNSGKRHLISTQAADSCFYHLPSSTKINAGTELEFLSNTTAASLFNFMTTGANAGGYIFCHLDSTNAVATTGAITNLSSGPLWIKFVCISTAGPLWACENLMAAAPTATTNAYYHLGAGTTA